MIGTRVPEVMRLLTAPSCALGTIARDGSKVRTLGVGILPGLCPITSFIPTSQGALGWYKAGAWAMSNTVGR